MKKRNGCNLASSSLTNYTSIDPKQQRQSEFSFLADPFLAPNLRPASRHAMGDKERQSKVIPAQHPDTPWETRGDEGRQSKIISAQHPDMPCGTRGDKGRQSKVISVQHPDTPCETKGDKANHLSPASRHAMGDKGRQRETKSSQPSIYI